MVLLVLGIACIVAGVVLALVHLSGPAVIALAVGAVLVLAWLIRRRRRRVTAGDAAILGAIGS